MPQRGFRLPHQVLAQGQFPALCLAVFICFQVGCRHVPFLADKVKLRTCKALCRLSVIGLDYLDFSCGGLVYMGILVNVVLHAPVDFHFTRRAVQLRSRRRFCLHYLVSAIGQFHIAQGNAVFICRQGIQYLIIFIPYLEYGTFQVHLRFNACGVLHFFPDFDLAFHRVVYNGLPIVVPVPAVFCL